MNIFVKVELDIHTLHHMGNYMMLQKNVQNIFYFIYVYICTIVTLLLHTFTSDYPRGTNMGTKYTYISIIKISTNRKI